MPSVGYGTYGRGLRAVARSGWFKAGFNRGQAWPITLVLSFKLLVISNVADSCPFVADGVEG